MLWRVDSSIVESYYARALQGELPLTSGLGSDESLSRLLEVVEIICGEDGESYAHQLKNVLKAMEGDGPLNKRPVLQDAVGETLSRMHSGRLPEQYRTYMLTHDFIGDSTWRGDWIKVSRARHIRGTVGLSKSYVARWNHGRVLS